MVSDTLAQCPNINCGSVTLWPDVSSVYSKICFTPNTVVKSKLHSYFTPFLCTVKESAASSYMRVHCLLGEVRKRARVMYQEYDIHFRLGLAFCLQTKNSLIRIRTMCEMNHPFIQECPIHWWFHTLSSRAIPLHICIVPHREMGCGTLGGAEH